MLRARGVEAVAQAGADHLVDARARDAVALRGADQHFQLLRRNMPIGR